MDAVAALNEIAFWLERERAATFKVQAFRKAAGVIADLEPAELVARAQDWRTCANAAPGRWPRAATNSFPPSEATSTATATGPTAAPPSP
jgi:hypothetical protein